MFAQHKSKRLGLAIAIFAALSSLASAQNAQVTFYVHGSLLKSGVPGTDIGVFHGFIYDGEQQLFPFPATMTGPRNDRFITLKMPAGSHDFSARDSKHPSAKQHLQVTLEPGKQYFFRAQSESRGVAIIEWEHGRLDQVTCQTAHQEAPNAKPAEVKYPSPIFTSMNTSRQSMPSCNDANSKP